MAIDGVKIIDSDLAQDIYSMIMDLYDDGATADVIRARLPFPDPGSYDEVEHEIYITAYALAMWEIGFLTKEMLQEVRNVNRLGAGVKYWTGETDDRLGKQRDVALHKLWVKVSVPNPKPRKRKKYKKIEQFVFEVNDVLAFQLPDGQYSATIVLAIKQYRGVCSYDLGKLVLLSAKQPTVKDVMKSGLVGRKIPNGLSVSTSSVLTMSLEEIMAQGGVEAILRKDAEQTGQYDLGFSMIRVEHKNLMLMADKFTRIGNLNLRSICSQLGSFRGALTIEDFILDFEDLENRMKLFGEEAFPLSTLVNE